MSNYKKIAAFTMVDILTGMVVMSIVIAMVFYLFTALNKQIADYGAIKNQVTNYLLLKTDLARKFDNPEATITGTPGGFIIQENENQITYLKKETKFFRNAPSRVDVLTDHLNDLNLQFVLNKKGQPTEFIQAVTLTVLFEKQELSVSFTKKYGLIDEMNLALLNEY